MTKDEALKMAFDALETYSQLGTTAKIRKAVAAVKKALAQPKREWVDLSYEEIDIASKQSTQPDSFRSGAMWAKAVLREENI